ncbi:MAG: protein jag [Veillonella sp.]|uniref:RNA-binding cell elongation regulator Jag/EloR n=1 Tax=Veillonella sp. TaxID=1926307 RepID=UPI0025FD9A85|nr:RNA-binding cell elongation regulator Jag/EloR [Veillonella sp.]MBS4913184.1 protein jag [Veillonella sp.]
MDFIEISAKTVEDAIAKGKAQLASEGKVVVDTKVLEEPAGGFLGFGRRDALIRIYFEEAAESESETVVESAVKEDVIPAAKSEEPVVSSEVADEVETAPKKDAKPSLSKEEQIQIADKGKQFLNDMFAKMGLTVQIEKMMTADKITYQIHGEELGILIGKHGQTLDAIQYLTNLVANKESAGRCYIVVDVENYRARREETLVNLAKRLASKVKRNRQKIALEPMSAFERKVIHLTLQNDPHIVTDSEGEEPYRHIVIAYKR